VNHRTGIRSLLLIVCGLLAAERVRFANPLGPQVHLREKTGHYYTWIATSMKWSDANRFANTFSTKVKNIVLDKWHLATITDAGENDFVFKVVLQGGELSGSESSFLGAIVKDGSVGNFKWVTGEAFRYKNFAPSQPDLERENVLEMGGVYGPQWNDEDGPGSPVEASHPFILEHEPIRVTLLR